MTIFLAFRSSIPWPLEKRPGRRYHTIMDDTGTEPPPGWAEAIQQSLAELAAGQTVPASIVHDEIRQAIAAMEAAMAAEDDVSVSPVPDP